MIIIIGAGPAGITAAIYFKRYNIPFKIISQNTGGQMFGAGIVENYPGFSTITGPECTNEMINHAQNLGIVFDYGNVIEVSYFKETWKVQYLDHLYKEQILHTSYLLICSGRRYKTLSIPNIEQWYNKGISFCATCDSSLFVNKKVAIIGGGNSALDSALVLSKVARDVTIINKNKQFKGELNLQQQVEAKNNIKIFYNTNTLNVYGDSTFEGIITREHGKMSFDGIFVNIGTIPNTSFIKDHRVLNEYLEIIVQSNCSTNIKGLYAAGDVTNIFYPQIVIAAGTGAQAAMTIRSHMHL